MILAHATFFFPELSKYRYTGVKSRVWLVLGCDMYVNMARPKIRHSIEFRYKVRQVLSGRYWGVNLYIICECDNDKTKGTVQSRGHRFQVLRVRPSSRSDYLRL